MSDIRDRLTPKQREVVDLLDAKGFTPRVEVTYKSRVGAEFGERKELLISGHRTVQIAKPCPCCDRGGVETQQNVNIRVNHLNQVTGTCWAMHRSVESYADVIRVLERLD